MTAKTSRALAALAIGLCAVTVAASVSYDLTSLTIANFYSRSIIVNEAPTLALMEKIFNERLPALQTISVIKAFPDKITAERILPGKGRSDVTEAEWFALYRDAVKITENMGEVIKVGTDVIIRVVQGDRVAWKVVRGNDPLACSPLLPGCQIIWINIRDVPPLLKGRFKQPLVDLFVKEDRLPTAAEALTASKILQNRFGTELLVVSFRTDEWFITDDLFPVVYPFLSPRRTAVLDEVRSSGEVTCASLGSGLHCAIY